jgi:hypothetical protein
LKRQALLFSRVGGKEQMKNDVRERAGSPETGESGMCGLISKIRRDQSPATASVRNDPGARTEERVFCGLPVDLGIATGVTRDISASGVFFETEATYPLSKSINFQVKLDTPQEITLVTCRGEIVRVEPRNKLVGVAVKITKAQMEQA